MDFPSLREPFLRNGVFLSEPWPVNYKFKRFLDRLTFFSLIFRIKIIVIFEMKIFSLPRKVENAR